MSDDDTTKNEKITRITREELALRAEKIEQIKQRNVYMSMSDELVHLEVQGIAEAQARQAGSISALQATVTQMQVLLEHVVLDRDDLVKHVRRLQAECEQLHQHQNATDARLEVIKAVFDAGMIDVRKAIEVAEKNTEQLTTLNKRPEPDTD